MNDAVTFAFGMQGWWFTFTKTKLTIKLLVLMILGCFGICNQYKLAITGWQGC